MDINIVLSVFAILMFSVVGSASIVILVVTVKNSISLNKQNLLNELVKQERELRIKLSEYRLQIKNSIDKGIPREEWGEIGLDYDTLLFNFYEYIAICLYEELVEERHLKRYFKDLLTSVKGLFGSSLLFEEGYSDKNQYLGLQWLFKRWNVGK